MTLQKETLDRLSMLELALASERVEWEREWKFSMRAAEDAILFFGGAPEIGFCLDPNEFSTGRMRAIEARDRQIKELERWQGWRHRADQRPARKANWRLRETGHSVLVEWLGWRVVAVGWRWYQPTRSRGAVLLASCMGQGASCEV